MFGGGRALVFEFEFVCGSSSSIRFFECQVFRGGAYELVHDLYMSISRWSCRLLSRLSSPSCSSMSVTLERHP